MIKKIFVFISTGLLALIAILVFINFAFLAEDNKFNLPHTKLRCFVPYDKHLKYTMKNPDCSRKPEGLFYSKKPVTIFGDAYAFGYGLNEKQTFGYKLSEFTKRPVYNFGFSAKGLQHALYIIQNKIYLKNMREPQYFIYVFVSEQVRQLGMPCSPEDNFEHLSYHIDNNGNFVRNNSPFKYLHSLYIYNKFLKETYGKYKFNTDFDKNFDLIKNYFLQMKKDLSAQYPSSEYVICLYPSSDISNEPYLRTQRWNELENEGIILINFDDLTGKKLETDHYRLPNDIHPSEEAWDVIVPALSKRLKL